MRARASFFNDQNRLVLLPFIRAGLPISRGQVLTEVTVSSEVMEGHLSFSQRQVPKVDDQEPGNPNTKSL